MLTQGTEYSSTVSTSTTKSLPSCQEEHLGPGGTAEGNIPAHRHLRNCAQTMDLFRHATVNRATKPNEEVYKKIQGKGPYTSNIHNSIAFAPPFDGLRSPPPPSNLKTQLQLHHSSTICLPHLLNRRMDVYTYREGVIVGPDSTHTALPPYDDHGGTGKRHAYRKHTDCLEMLCSRRVFDLRREESTGCDVGV